MQPRLVTMIVASRWDASGGRKSKGRTMLLEILKTRTIYDVASELHCSPQFVSFMSTGRRKPSRWELVQRMADRLGIAGEDW
jgi:hypothetical protein